MRKFLYIFFLFLTANSWAQTDLKIGDLPGAKSASAALDVASITKGLLIPRMTTVQMNAITSPTLGLMVFNLDSNCVCFYSSSWKSQCSAANLGAWTILGNSNTTPSTNFLGTTNAQDLVIKTNNTEKLRILSGGNVGINTATPSYKLDIDAQTASLGNPLRLLGLNAGATTDSILTSSSGIVRRLSIPQVVSNAWNILGNSGTVNGTNFLGTTDNVPLAFRVNNIQAFKLDTNYSLLRDAGGVTRGAYAVDLQNFRTTSAQVASGTYSFIGGGQNNTASGSLAVVGGGKSNLANNVNVFLGGGCTNISSGNLATLVGGQSNTASGLLSFVGAGTTNVSGGSYSTLVGGSGNTASGDFSSVLGGLSNTASNASVFLGGGSSNTASGSIATLVGGNNNSTAGDYSFIGGGSSNTISTGSNNTVIGGGISNKVQASYATVSGGYFNNAINSYSFIGGGATDTTSANYAAVVAGINNNSGGISGIIGGGQSNKITTGSSNGILTGYLNTVSNNYAGILGGQSNTASGSNAGILGGYGLTLGDNSVGFNGYTSNANKPNVSANTNIAYFGDVDVWLGNVNNAAKALSFYSPNSSLTYSGAFYTSFKAGVQSANINYILPLTAPTSTNTILTSDATGNLSWSSTNALAWTKTGNSGTSATTNFLGTTDAVDLVFRTTNTEYMRLTSNGKLGIGTTVPDQLLSVNGGASKSGGGAWSTFSDYRIKKNIAPYSDGLSLLKQIHPVQFQYNGLSSYNDTSKQYIGVIAQEIEKIAPYMVEKVKTSAFPDQRLYDPSALVYILINAVKEQNTKMETLENDNAHMAKKLEAQKEEIEKLNNKMTEMSTRFELLFSQLSLKIEKVKQPEMRDAKN